MLKDLLYEADLHCHTTASDGELTPAGVVQLAAKSGLKALAITDHDTISGLKEAEIKAQETGLILVKGIEINTEGPEKEIHILGLGLDDNSSCLKEKLLELQKKRIARSKEILEKLRKLGIEIPFQKVLSFAKGESVGRPHIAKAMFETGYVEDFREAFTDYLRLGGPAYVPREKLSPSTAIQIIRKSDGVAVLAHPGSQVSEKEIKNFICEGLQGIEVEHPDHSPADVERLKELAIDMNLIATGGSDFHGEGVKPGIKIGAWGVGLEVLEQLNEARAKV